MGSLNIEQRVNACIVLGRYLRAKQRIEEASKELMEVSEKAQQVLPPIGQFVAKFDYQDYLVTIPGDGSFTIEKIESL